MKPFMLMTALGICLASAATQAPGPAPHMTRLASAQQERQVAFPMTGHHRQAGQARTAGYELTA